MEEWLQTIIKLGLAGSMFTLKFAQALEITAGDLTFIRKEPAQMLRSIAAVDLLVPVVAVLAIFLLHPPRATAIGLALVAAFPGRSARHLVSCSGWRTTPVHRQSSSHPGTPGGDHNARHAGTARANFRFKSRG